MGGAIAYYCNCGDRLGPRGGHLTGCPLLRRLRIKEIVCNRLGVGHYVPEDVQAKIDRLVSSDLSVRQVAGLDFRRIG